jgi:hypothetical protein
VSECLINYRFVGRKRYFLSSPSSAGKFFSAENAKGLFLLLLSLLQCATADGSTADGSALFLNQGGQEFSKVKSAELPIRNWFWELANFQPPI